MSTTVKAAFSENIKLNINWYSKNLINKKNFLIKKIKCMKMLDLKLKFQKKSMFFLKVVALLLIAFFKILKFKIRLPDFFSVFLFLYVCVTEKKN